MSRADRIIMAACLLALAAAVAIGLSWSAGRSARTVYTDADTIREPASAAPLRSILWQPPVMVAGPVNSPGQEYEPRISADGQLLLFVRGKAGANADIFFATRTPDGWSAPEPLAAVNSAADDLGPDLSADGQTLYFYSNRPGSLGGYDIWVSRRSNDASQAWGEPVNAGPAINTPYNEYSPAQSPDGGVLYFASNRPRPGEAPATEPTTWPATIRERLVKHDYDLYAAAITQGEITPAYALTELNTPANEGTPGISPVGDFLYFSSDREGGAGGLDLYRSRLLRGRFQSPENLGSTVNSPYDDLDPAPSMGGFALHFSSSRPPVVVAGAERVGPENPGTFDLYQTASREVFRETEPRKPIDWAGMWATIWPYLMWLLLSLLALLLLLRLIKELRERKLGILSKCLLASLLAHILLMFLLNMWGVSSSIGELFRRAGGTKVHLTQAEPGADALAQQVRGQLTDTSITVPDDQPQVQFPVLGTPEPLLVQAEISTAVASVPQDRPAPPMPQADSPARASDAPSTRPQVDPNASLAALQTPAPPVPAQTSEASAPQTQPSAQPEPLSPSIARDESAIKAPEHAPSPAQPVAQAILRNPSSSREAQPPAATAHTATAAIHVDPSAATTAAIPQTPVSQAREEASARVTVETPAAAAPAPETPINQSSVRQSVVSAPPSVPSPSQSFAQNSSRESDPQSQPNPATSLALHAPREPDTTNVAIPSESAPARPAEAQPAPFAGAARSEPIIAPPSAAPVREPTAIQTSAAPSRPDASAMPSTVQARESAASMQVPLATPRAPAPSAPLSLAALALPTETASRPAPSDAREPRPVVPPSPGVVDLRPTVPAEPAQSRAVAQTPSPARTRPDDAPLLESSPETRRESTISSDNPAITRLAAPAPPDAPLTDLKLPTETAPPVSQYAQRAPEQRQRIVDRLGGSPDTERAVNLALAWLAAHQSQDGRWSGQDFDDNCGQCDGHATADSDAAQTGLALLCFLGADHSHLKDGPYRDTVARGVRWLLKQQSADGDLRRDETMYSHGIATIALSEAYGITRDPDLKEPVAAAARFIVAALNKRSGGWRYDPGQAGDTSVLGWQVMALTSARRAGIDIPEDAFEAARDWLDKVSQGSPGLYAYQPRQAPTPSMTAEGLFSQQLLGRGHDEPRMQASVELIMQNLPRWGGGGPGDRNRNRTANTYFWYYATLAMFQHQGDDWTRWNAALTRALLSNQETRGKAAGSWAPADRWSRTGGRIYQTAVCTLSLEVYYRYLPLYGAEAKP